MNATEECWKCCITVINFFQSFHIFNIWRLSNQRFIFKQQRAIFSSLTTNNPGPYTHSEPPQPPASKPMSLTPWPHDVLTRYTTLTRICGRWARPSSGDGFQAQSSCPRFWCNWRWFGFNWWGWSRFSDRTLSTVIPFFLRLFTWRDKWDMYEELKNFVLT